MSTNKFELYTEENNIIQASVFEKEYIPTSKAVDYEKSNAVIFKIDNDNSNNNFYKIIIKEFTEEHSEVNSQHNTLSDSVAIFATGPAPIQITIDGWLLVSKSDDHSFEFLTRYVNDFRARRLDIDSKTLVFICKDTWFRLIISSISLRQSHEFETYYEIVITGCAYDYNIL